MKLWNTATWEAELELPGPDPSDKQRAIWAVLAYSNTIVITGSADHVIRGYTLQGSRTGGELQAGVVIRTPDVVRALSRVRKHPTGAKIASAGNDFLIRLWQFNGAEVGMLHGHESFIYALDSLPTGELVSSSEDRTVRIWKGLSCIQTISHPALSIWSVSVCQQTGDFATGASDNVARVFTRNRERIASPEVLQEFSEAVQHSAIPQQQVGDVNPSTLPGPEFIETKAGTKDGQTVMINAGGGNIHVYQWSVGKKNRHLKNLRIPVCTNVWIRPEPMAACRYCGRFVCSGRKEYGRRYTCFRYEAAQAKYPSSSGVRCSVCHSCAKQICS